MRVTYSVKELVAEKIKRLERVKIPKTLITLNYYRYQQKEDRN